MYSGLTKQRSATLRLAAPLFLISIALCTSPIQAQVTWEPLPAPAAPWKAWVNAGASEFLVEARDSLYISVDGCRNWSPVRLPVTGGRLTHWDWREGGRGVFLFAQDVDTLNCTIAWTYDYGQHWDVLNSGPIENPYPQLGPAAPALRMLSDSVLLRSVGGWAYRSANKGLTWSRLQTHVGAWNPPLDPAHMQILSDSVTWDQGVEHFKDLRRSTDQGATWARLHRAPYIADRVYGLSADHSGRLFLLGNMETGENWGSDVIYLTQPNDSVFTEVWKPRDERFPTAVRTRFSVMVHEQGWLWMFAKHLWRSGQRLYRTSDGGKSWEWLGIEREVLRAWRSGEGQALVLTPQHSLYRMSLPNSAPLRVSADNQSTKDSLLVRIRWNGPAATDETRCIVERAGMDSIWAPLANISGAINYYFDSDVRDGQVLRYRITTSMPHAELRAYSDATTPISGEYYDLLGAIIPRENKLLRYSLHRVVRNKEIIVVDTTFELRCAFLPAYDSTQTIRVHPMQFRQAQPDQSESVTNNRIVEYIGAEPTFEEFWTLWTFGNLRFGVELRMNWQGDVPTLLPKPFPTRVLTAALLNPGSDTIDFKTFVDGYVPGVYMSQYQAVNGRGIVFVVPNETTDTLRLIESINTIPEQSLSESALVVDNYPNPFRTSTTIRFSLARAADVRLTVHDLLGRVVAEIASGWRERGEYNIHFLPGALPTGIYLYRLITGTAVRSGKMYLMR